jgi:haloacetate dehalogenase
VHASGFFDGFTLEHIDGEAGATLRVRHGGEGPPVVLLHGHPRTHATWHLVAARLAPHHTVVCADLRGYGESSKVEPYTKRAMAQDVVGVMRALGHQRFAVVGHDRGAYVATRLGLEHEAAVERVVVLQAMPLAERLERADWRFALSWWHWWFFAQLDKPAEDLINADPDAWYPATPEHMGEEAYADLRRALRDPEVVHAMMQDYRAGLREDHEHDEADRAAGRRSRARCSSFRCSRTTWSSTTASTYRRSGGPGRLTFAARRSTAAITLPRKSRTTSRDCSSTSSKTDRSPTRPPEQATRPASGGRAGSRERGGRASRGHCREAAS